jgi:hypothetical protein
LPTLNGGYYPANSMAATNEAINTL